MCGIAGIISPNSITPVDERALTGMVDSLAHRGPDDSGQHITRDVALGHRRLSIIDLETGRQPLSNEAENVWAVVNGEFYNFMELRDELSAKGHAFRTTSDSECLVHAYEDTQEQCVKSLDGMFAFALWDDRTKTAILGRDRLGVKPLYYHFDGRRLVFGSELKAVLVAPNMHREIDPTAVADYLTYSFIPAPKTIFKNIHKLPAGHILVFREGSLAIRPYWDLCYNGRTPLRGDDLSRAVWFALRRATRPRLITDVPVGAFLSGGLDSTAVVAAMARVARNDILTVTCGFDERSFDERTFAADVAGQLGTEHHETLARPDAATIVDTLSRHFDEPFADASAIPMYHLSEQTRKLVTVALSGDGGDEVLAGYRRYRFDQYEQIVRQCMPAFLRRWIFGSLAAIYPRRRWIPRLFRAGATLQNIATDAGTAHGLSVSTLDPDSAIALLAPDIAQAIDGYDPLEHARSYYEKCDAPDHLSRCQYVDVKLGLGEGILTKVDRASMAHALEVRSPMLDHRFIEFAWSIKPGDRIRGLYGKAPLRRLVRNMMGDKIADRRKRGFEVPLDAWFRGPLKERFFDSVISPDAPLHQWLETDGIRQTWQRHLDRVEDCGPTLWKFIMLDAWLRTYAAPTRQSAPEPESPPVEPSCV